MVPALPNKRAKNKFHSDTKYGFVFSIEPVKETLKLYGPATAVDKLDIIKTKPMLIGEIVAISGFKISPSILKVTNGWKPTIANSKKIT